MNQGKSSQHRSGDHFERLNDICIDCKYKLNLYVSFLLFVSKVSFESLLNVFSSPQIISLVSSAA